MNCNITYQFNSLLKSNRAFLYKNAKKVVDYSQKFFEEEDALQDIKLHLWNVLNTSDLQEVEDLPKWSRTVIHNYTTDICRSKTVSKARKGIHRPEAVESDDCFFSFAIANALMKPKCARTVEVMESRSKLSAIVRICQDMSKDAEKMHIKRKWKALEDFFDPSEEVVEKARRKIEDRSRTLAEIKSNGWTNKRWSSRGYEHLDISDFCESHDISHSYFRRGLAELKGILEERDVI